MGASYFQVVSWTRPAADFAFFDNDGLPIPFAHRGGALTGSNVGLENSMVAFEAAVALGYRHLETDVHATRDGTLLAFHDSTLDRATGLVGRVLDLDHAQVVAARIGGREPIPLLSEIFTAWPEVRLNIDAKSNASVAPLARCIEQHRAWDRVCVASFSPGRLHALRSLLGHRVATSYSAVGVAALRLLPAKRTRAALLGRSGQAAQVPVRRLGLEIVTDSFITRAHELGRQVHVWTIDEQAEMHRLLDLGVDALMTDRLDVLRGVFEARGIWRG